MRCKANGTNRFDLKPDICELIAGWCVTMTGPTGLTDPDEDPTW
jgi:hypothetical protein